MTQSDPCLVLERSHFTGGERKPLRWKAPASAVTKVATDAWGCREGRRGGGGGGRGEGKNAVQEDFRFQAEHLGGRRGHLLRKKNVEEQVGGIE